MNVYVPHQTQLNSISPTVRHHTSHNSASSALSVGPIVSGCGVRRESTTSSSPPPLSTDSLSGHSTGIGQMSSVKAPSSAAVALNSTPPLDDSIDPATECRQNSGPSEEKGTGSLPDLTTASSARSQSYDHSIVNLVAPTAASNDTCEEASETPMQVPQKASHRPRPSGRLDRFASHGRQRSTYLSDFTVTQNMSGLANAATLPEPSTVENTVRSGSAALALPAFDFRPGNFTGAQSDDSHSSNIEALDDPTSLVTGSGILRSRLETATADTNDAIPGFQTPSSPQPVGGQQSSQTAFTRSHRHRRSYAISSSQHDLGGAFSGSRNSLDTYRKPGTPPLTLGFGVNQSQLSSTSGSSLPYRPETDSHRVEVMRTGRVGFSETVEVVPRPLSPNSDKTSQRPTPVVYSHYPTHSSSLSTTTIRQPTRVSAIDPSVPGGKVEEGDKLMTHDGHRNTSGLHSTMRGSFERKLVILKDGNTSLSPTGSPVGRATSPVTQYSPVRDRPSAEGSRDRETESPAESAPVLQTASASAPDARLFTHPILPYAIDNKTAPEPGDYQQSSERKGHVEHAIGSLLPDDLNLRQTGYEQREPRLDQEDQPRRQSLPTQATFAGSRESSSSTSTPIKSILKPASCKAVKTGVAEGDEPSLGDPFSSTTPESSRGAFFDAAPQHFLVYSNPGFEPKARKSVVDSDDTSPSQGFDIDLNDASLPLRTYPSPRSSYHRTGSFSEFSARRDRRRAFSDSFSGPFQHTARPSSGSDVFEVFAEDEEDEEGEQEVTEVSVDPSPLAIVNRDEEREFGLGIAVKDYASSDPKFAHDEVQRRLDPTPTAGSTSYITSTLPALTSRIASPTTETSTVEPSSVRRPSIEEVPSLTSSPSTVTSAPYSQMSSVSSRSRVAYELRSGISGQRGTNWSDEASGAAPPLKIVTALPTEGGNDIDSPGNRVSLDSPLGKTYAKHDRHREPEGEDTARKEGRIRRLNRVFRFWKGKDSLRG